MKLHLAELLEVLARAQDLATVTAEVDAEFEMAEAAVQARPKAVLFTRVRGRRFASVVNLWSAPERICRSLGAEDVDVVCERWRSWFAPESGWLARLASGRLFSAEKTATRSVRAASCQQVVELNGDFDLCTLPWVRAWPEEQRPGTAAALVLLQPKSGETYANLHPVLCLDATRLCVAFDAEGRLAHVLRMGRGRSQPIPAVIVLGPPPALLLAAAAYVPEEFDRWQLAAAWQGSPIETARARAVDLDVPAHAELVIEGHIDPNAPLVETGPLPGPYGWYEPSRPAAVFESAALTRRANPVLPMVALSPPPHELDTLYGLLMRLLKPLACSLVPQLVDYSAPVACGTGRVVAAAIRKRRAFDSHQAASLLWGWGHWLQAKLLILVDEWVDVHHFQQVLLAVAAHARGERDHWSLSAPGWDGSEERSSHHCLVLDATCKSLPDDAAPSRLLRDAAVIERVQQLLRGLHVERRRPEEHAGP